MIYSCGTALLSVLGATGLISRLKTVPRQFDRLDSQDAGADDKAVSNLRPWLPVRREARSVGTALTRTPEGVEGGESSFAGQSFFDCGGALTKALGSDRNPEVQ